MPRVAIVTRVSTEEQARLDYNSCKSQEDLCRHYVELQRDNGWEVFRVYEDAGYSGTSLKRPGIQALLRDARRGLVDVLLCTRLDRVSRSIRQFHELWSTLDRHGVTLVSATESFDTSSAAGSLMVNLLLSFGAWEVAVVSERTTMKLLARARRGLWNGGNTPLGMDYRRDLQLLVPNPDEAPTVVAIFDALLREGSIAGARQYVNDQGLRTKRRQVSDRSGQVREVGNNPFSYDAIRSVITNPLYKGFVRHGGQEFKGVHEPLIPVEKWELANRLIEGRPRGGRSPSRTPDSHVHLLKGLLRCGECGSTMTPYPSGKRKPDGGEAYLYYTCVSVVKDPERSQCRIRSLPARPLEEGLLHTWESLASDPSFLDQCLVAGLASDSRHYARLQERVEALRGQLADVEGKLERLLGVFEESETVPQRLKLRCSELDELRTGLRLDIMRVEDEMEEIGGAAPDAAEVAEFLMALTNEIRALPVPERKAKIASVVTRVVVNRLDPSGGFDVGQPRSDGADARTRAILVDIQMRSRPAESVDSAGLRAEHVNRTGAGSDLGSSGSPARIRTRNPLVNSQSLYR